MAMGPLHRGRLRQAQPQLDDRAAVDPETRGSTLGRFGYGSGSVFALDRVGVATYRRDSISGPPPAFDETQFHRADSSFANCTFRSLTADEPIRWSSFRTAWQANPIWSELHDASRQYGNVNTAVPLTDFIYFYDGAGERIAKRTY